MVYDSPRKINEYLFADRPETRFLRVLAEANANVLLFGHTHKPYHRTFSYEHGGETCYHHAQNARCEFCACKGRSSGPGRANG